MQAITGWLQSHGFQLGAPTKGRTVLEFSGSASQVQEAFHTVIHKYVVNGEQHWANSIDPQIPTALTPAVAGVLTLHNFLKKPMLHFSGKPVAATIHPGKKPYVTLSDGTHALGPYDYATIYNSPAFKGSIMGESIIGIVGRSNLFNVQGQNGGDVVDFRNLFNLCCGLPQVLLNGPDPGDLGGGDEAEATLDITWAGAVAPGEQTDLVVSASTNTADGVDLSEVYIVENNFADIMTESFGSCEATATNAAGIAGLAEQAAAQGVSYFVSTGDSGAEGCDSPDIETVASGPVSVNVLASTNFNTAVGGTMFNENGLDATYWSTTNTTTNTQSALSYIPEDVWNESCENCTDPAIWAGGGGASIFSNGLKPSWQSGVTGIPADNARDLPDVSLTAAGHDGYIVCLEGSCVPDSSGNFFIYLISGTSASTPSFAGIMALVEQQVENVISGSGESPRQGQATYVLYRLAAAESTPLSQCNGSSTAGLPNSACIFNDVTMGNNAVPGEVNYGSTGALYQAGVGYDMATGLGSVNITNLVNQWNSVTFSPTTTNLTLTPILNITHGSAVSVSIAVAPSSGAGTPTGDVSLLAFNGLWTAVDGFTLSNGTVAQSTSQLPGGSYQVEAQYAGDATFAPSVSNQFGVVVTPESSTTALSVLSFNSQGQQVNFTSGPFGSFVYLRADVKGNSGYGTPTGSVTFTDTFGQIPGGGTYPLNTGDTLNGGSTNTATPNGVVTFDTGTHTISSTYPGDASFNASASTPPITFTITPGFFAQLSGPSQVAITTPGGTGTTAVQVSYSSGLTGTITLACAGLPSEATCTFSPASVPTTATSSSVSSSITVTTTAAHTVTSKNIGQSPYFLAHYLTGGFAFAGVFFFGLPKRRRAAILSLMILLALLIVVPACGGGGGSGNNNKVTTTQDPGTPTGSYNITVTATNGSNVQGTGFSLVVQ
jgi:hypothetical protein